MKKQTGIFFHLTLGAAVLAIVVACQQRRFTLAQQNYQQKAERAIANLASHSSAAYRGVTDWTNPATPTTVSSDFSLVPYANPTSYYPTPSSTPTWATNVPPQQYMGDAAQAVAQCNAAVKAIPQTKETYAVAMATLSRCLNRLVQERSYMTTWMYQNMNPYGQYGWAYSMNYGRYGSYNQMPQSDQQWVGQYAGTGGTMMYCTPTSGGGYSCTNVPPQSQPALPTPPPTTNLPCCTSTSVGSCQVCPTL